MPAFLGILGLQGLALLAIPHAGSAVAFYVLCAIVYTCYGGAFGTLPSTAGDFFGVKNSGAIYGLMLIGWSIGGVVGPLLISWLIGEDQAYTLAFTVEGLGQLGPLRHEREELVVEALDRQPAQKRRGDGPQLQVAGQRGEGVAPVGVGRAFQIVLQDLQLGVAGGREGQPLEQKREVLHSSSSS